MITTGEYFHTKVYTKTGPFLFHLSISLDCPFFWKRYHGDVIGIYSRDEENPVSSAEMRELLRTIHSGNALDSFRYKNSLSLCLVKFSTTGFCPISFPNHVPYYICRSSSNIVSIAGLLLSIGKSKQFDQTKAPGYGGYSSSN